MRFNTKLFYIFLISLFFSHTALLQSTEPISIDTLLQTVLNHNLSKRIEFTKYEIQKATSTRAEAGYFPIINGSYSSSSSNGEASYTYLSNDSSTTESTNNSTSTLSQHSISLSHTLKNSIRPFYTYKKLQQALTISEAQYFQFIDQLILDTTIVAYDILRLQKNITLLKQIHTHSLQYVTESQQQLELGALTQREVLDTQFDANSYKSQVIHSQLDYKKQRYLLNQLMGEPPEKDLTLLSTVPIDTTLLLDTLKSHALDYNLSIQIANQTTALSNTEIKLIQTDLYPDLSLSFDYGSTHQSRNSSYIRDSSSDGLQIQASLSWTLFNGARRLNALRSIKKIKELDRLNKNHITSLLITELYSTYAEYESVIKQLSIQKDQIDTKSLAYNQSTFLYQSGQISLTDLHTSHVELLQTKKQYNDIEFQCKVIELKLHHLSGSFRKPLPGSPATIN